MSTKIPRLYYAKIGVIWLVLSAVLGLGTGLLTLSLDDDLRQRGVSTTAEVTYVECGGVGKGQHFNARAAVGELLFIDCPQAPEKLHVGEQVQVTYDPLDTSNVVLSGYSDRVLGVVFTAIGVVAALMLVGWVALDARRGFRSAEEDEELRLYKLKESADKEKAALRKSQQRAERRAAIKRREWPRAYRGRHRS